MRRTLALGLLSLVLVLLVPRARAAAQDSDVDAELTQIDEQIVNAHFDDALRGLDRVLGRQDLRASQRNGALELLAVAQIAKRNRTGAAQTLALLYRRDPGYELRDPNASPVVQRAFADARQARSDTVPVSLVDATSPPEPGQGIELRVRVANGADAVENVKIWAKRSGQPGFTATPVDVVDGVAETTLPPGTGRYTVDYYFEAVAPSGAVLTSLGSEDEPKHFDAQGATIGQAPATAGWDSTEPRHDEDSSGGGVTSKWWFWGGIGVVAVAIGVTVGVVLLSGGSAEPGSLGQTTLTLH